MPAITRPVKTGGTTRYTTEVAAGFDVIKATEVDNDLDLAYQTIDALDDANIKTGANIHGSKIAPGTLPAAQIAAGSITDTQISNTANINGSKLLNTSVTGAKLANLGVTTAKLNVNASSVQVTQGLVTASLSFTTTETPVVSAAITTRGGNVRIYGNWALRCQTTAAGTTGVVTVRLKRDGTIIFALDVPIVSALGATLAFWTIPMPAPFIDAVTNGLTPGAHTYLITAVSSGPNYVLFTSASAFGGGFLQLEEAA